MSRAILFAALLIPLAFAATPARADDVTDADVANAIERLRSFLYQQQDKDGTWDNGGVIHGAYNSGFTALVTTALLTSGDSVQNPKLKKSIEFLRAAEADTKTSHGTYEMALHAHVWAKLSDDYKKDLQHATQWLENDAWGDTTFTYTWDGNAPHSTISSRGNVSGNNFQPWDHSNTQYGILGLWESSKRGVFRPTDFWPRVAAHWLEYQKDDGGWGYVKLSPRSEGAMSAAGVTALLIAEQEMYQGGNKPDKQIAAGIDKGLKWIDANWDPHVNTNRGGFLLYYLYCIERVGIASGVKDLNGKDWFRTGAQFIIDGMGGRGASDTGQIDLVPDAAFALMFLSRGRVPVWANKLVIPSDDKPVTNNHPNEMYFLTRFLSDEREAELNFQRITVDTPVDEWTSAPVTYLSSDSELSFSRDQRIAIQRYVDLGGLMVFNTEERSEKFSAAVKTLMTDLYPGLSWQPIKDGHPLLTTLHQVPASAAKVLVLTNGARDLAYLFLDDMGKEWQYEDLSAKSHAVKLGGNLFALAANRGVLTNRLVPRLEPRTNQPNQAMTIGRPSYGGNWLPEPAAVEPWGNRLCNRAAIDLTVAGKPTDQNGSAARAGDLPLSSIGTSNIPLMHVQGVDAVTFDKDEIAAMKQYIARGGTLLFESVGGAGTFATAAGDQLAKALSDDAHLRRVTDLRADDPILTGRDLPGGYTINDVTYRRYAVAVVPAIGKRPRLQAIYVDDRPAVLVSAEDLSLAALNVPRWNVAGYTHDSAMKLLTNVALAAAKKK